MAYQQKATVLVTLGETGKDQHLNRIGSYDDQFGKTAAAMAFHSR
jgi:hypothetical protein